MVPAPPTPPNQPAGQRTVPRPEALYHYLTRWLAFDMITSIEPRRSCEPSNRSRLSGPPDFRRLARASGRAAAPP